MVSFRSVIELRMTVTWSVSSVSFGFGLGQFCFARLNPLACFDQLGVELGPLLGERHDVLAEALLLRAARLQLLRGFVEFLLRLLAGEVVLRRND